MEKLLPGWPTINTEWRHRGGANQGLNTLASAFNSFYFCNTTSIFEGVFVARRALTNG
ncbi:MAG: hypothetical protein WBD34_16190 [Burkholderiaceae bacterium]